MTYTQQEQREVAETIVRQIPVWLKMAVGFQKPVFTETGVRFQVRGRGTYIVVVDYDRGADLYDVQVWSKSRAPRCFHEHKGAYAEDMIEIINRIDKGELAAS